MQLRRHLSKRSPSAPLTDSSPTADIAGGRGTRGARRRRRISVSAAGIVAIAAVVAGLLAAVPSDAAGPPPNPTNGQISAAQQQKDAVATEVGQLSAQVATAQGRLDQLNAQAELKEQQYAYAQQKLQEAQDAATAAKAASAAAQQKVDAAERDFTLYVQAAYISGPSNSMTGALLTAGDPSELLERSTLEQYSASDQISAIKDLQRAKVTQSNADAAARKAVSNQTAAAAAAKTAEADAVAAANTAAQQQQQLQATLTSTQTKLQQAKLELATLNNQRVQYLAYVKRQQQIAAAKAAAAAAAERRANAEAARERAAAAAAAAKAARQHKSSHSSGSSGGGGGGGGGGTHGSTSVTSSPVIASGGSWTAAKGRAAVKRAKTQLGMPYAWAGGNSSGPTYGVCAPGNSINDCHVDGFDCSGLTLFGWAPFTHLDHYTVSQYGNAGSYHPSPGNFKPGDLLFWSDNGRASGIHHVAMYIGNGDVIQAPHSGSYVKITPWQSVTSGYYGAVRPMT